MNDDWITDYANGLRQAHGRLLVVHFWMAGRPLCKTMNDETLSSPQVVKALRESFVKVKVDIDAHPDLFRDKVGGRGGLATCVLDDTGDVVSVLPGFADTATFLRFLEKAHQGIERLRTLRALVSLIPEDPATLHALAETYLALNSPLRAEKHYRKLLEMSASPKHVALAHERIARLRALRGKLDEAKRHIMEYRRLDPEGAFGRLDRILVSEAIVLLAEMKYSDAIRHVEEALKRFPTSEESDQMLYVDGIARHELKDDAGALKTLESLIGKHPASPWVISARERIAHIKNPPPGHDH